MEKVKVGKTVMDYGMTPEVEAKICMILSLIMALPIVVLKLDIQASSVVKAIKELVSQPVDKYTLDESIK